MAEKKQRRRGDLAPNPEMWEALQQGEGLTTILEDFYTRVYADERLAPFFEGTTKQRAIEKQWNFLCQIFTGEKVYFGDRPRNAHHWMVVDDGLFDYREELMESCLRRYGLPEHLVQKWRAMEECFRPQIVKDEPFGKKINGVELPFTGYEGITLSMGWVCDGCGGEMNEGERVHYHRRTGQTYCPTCVPGEKPSSVYPKAIS